MDIKQESVLFECKHCEGTGTCRTSENGASCAACVKGHELKPNRFFRTPNIYYGLRCGTCNGLLVSDLTTTRMNRRIQPVLSIGVLATSAVISGLAVVFDRSLGPQIFTAWIAIFSTMTGFYFSKKGEQ